ncbi:MAG TPA: tyrosine--tRNA ligase [Candidatus Cloacimonadota bacterium]|nr:tyrosine--tRNA ligase [Candidatus Cloacimonadota bacterium]
MLNFAEQLKLIKKGTEEITPLDELIKKVEKSIKTGKPLRVKYGIDPTGSDVHIGHLVPIRKMREFQDMGHIGVIIIGDTTAQIGDPTGRDESRPPLSKEQVIQNSERYMEQLFTVLDRDKTEIRYQSEWFSKLNLLDIINIFSNFTLAQFMAHDTFRKRFDDGSPLFMNEMIYPILQGYDSVAIDADIELGATEQKFNILFGRDMQKLYNKELQVAILSPILLGTCGTRKMGKSFNNYIAVFDTSTDKYGKVMSIPDSLIMNYFNYATKVDPDEIEKIKEELVSGVNPKFIKQRLAREIVSLYHGEEEALKAEEEFNRVFSQKELPTEIDSYLCSESPIWIIKLLTDAKLCASSSEARRMIKQGAVSIDNAKISDENLQLDIEDGAIIKVGKRRFIKLQRG